MIERPVIQTRNLTKVYQMGDTKVHALRGVSITVREGEMVAIMGPSGSGKSTLMAILGALDLPTTGSYRLDGREISRMNGRQLAQVRNSQIGFVFQQFNLLPRSTALANTALPLVYNGAAAKERTARARKMLHMVGLGNRLDHKPTELSGGQQQRLAVARALINNPSIILADEPTGNLDTKTGDEIMSLFKRLHSRHGITLVVVTHDPEVAAQTERIIYLRDGVVADLPEELVALGHLGTAAPVRRPRSNNNNAPPGEPPAAEKQAKPKTKKKKKKTKKAKEEA